MTALLIRKALRRTLDEVRYVTPVRPGPEATGLVTAVYLQVERDFGMLAPPVALHSPAPGPLAASWLMLRDTLISPGLATRAAKEVVAATVSIGNSCPYCVAVHGAALYVLAGSRDAAAIADDRLDSITDPALRDLAQWVRETGVDRPFPIEQTPELAGVAVTFHYLNRMVNVFLDETPLPPQVPAAARGLLLRVLGWITRPPRTLGSRPAGPDLLPPAPLPDDLSWAAGNPDVADSLARATAAIEAAGRRSVPEPVRDLVTTELSTWDGRPPGISRAWLDEPVSGLAPEHRPAGRLALLTALASYQVTGSDIADFRRDQPTDEALIDLASWASLTAARAVTAHLTTRHPIPTAG